MAERIDKELEEFRNVMEVPSTFEEGFRWSSLLGALFVALLMVPGAIYMGLLAGTMEIASAASWVTVILFIEVAKRAQRSLNRAEIFVLFPEPSGPEAQHRSILRNYGGCTDLFGNLDWMA